jgi:hypothetical protein
MEWLWNFFQTRADVDQSTAIGSGFIKCINALIIFAGHFLDTCISEYKSKFLMIAVDGLFFLLESPH